MYELTSDKLAEIYGGDRWCEDTTLNPSSSASSDACTNLGATAGLAVTSVVTGGCMVASALLTGGTTAAGCAVIGTMAGTAAGTAATSSCNSNYGSGAGFPSGYGSSTSSTSSGGGMFLVQLGL